MGNSSFQSSLGRCEGAHQVFREFRQLGKCGLMLSIGGENGGIRIGTTFT